MSGVAIRVEGLGKKYLIGGPQKDFGRLSDQLADMIIAPFRRAGRLLRGQAVGAAELEETIWALRDLDFEIRHGEAVGIIGRNGAGKTTLLKILSRITEPTEGYADVWGRVGSLLEVGTGFHPELTGRENVYLNGAILGMKKPEIDRKFDEIVAFSGIEKFIDTPVKHYSSGMYVRLAFSVAAYLEPEILLVDEVLAVGDMAFQKKCMGKMDDVAHQGRTVLFVSHNMGLIQTLCQHGILLENGRITAQGGITDVVDTYLRTLEIVSQQPLSEREDRRGRGRVRLLEVEVSDGRDPPSHVLRTGEPAHLVLRVSSLLPDISLFVDVLDEFGRPVTKFKNDYHSGEDSTDPSMGCEFVCEVDELLLVPGRYQLDVLVRADNEWQDFVEAATFVDVEQGHLRGRLIVRDTKRPVGVVMPHRWIVPGYHRGS